MESIIESIIEFIIQFIVAGFATLTGFALGLTTVDVAVDFISNLGGIRIYEAVIFRIVKIENMNDEEAAKAIVDDTVNLIRKQTKLVFEEAAKTGEFTRDVARRLFTPDKSDTPDM